MTAAGADRLRALVREIPDFPSPGVSFKDITPLFADPAGLEMAIDGLAQRIADHRPELVVSAEARGFVLGGALAARSGAGFVVARKPGRLPREVASMDYELEYGSDSLEVHADALHPGARVVVHDDLLATGGTAQALCRLVEQAGGEVVCCAFVIELGFLAGRARLEPRPVESLLRYEA